MKIRRAVVSLLADPWVYVKTFRAVPIMGQLPDLVL